MNAIEPASDSNVQTQVNYDRFITELTTLSRKYGVALQSVEGFIHSR